MKEKTNQLSTVSKRNAAQFYKYTRLTEEKKKKKTNLLWRYSYVADRDAWVVRIERERERKGSVSQQTHVTGSTEGMIHGQGTLAHAPNFASHTGRQAHHLTY